MKHLLGIAPLLCCLSALSYGQALEPIEGIFDIENAVAMPPPPAVVTATPNKAELGPAVTNQNQDTNPLPIAVAAPVTTAVPVSQSTLATTGELPAQLAGSMTPVTEFNEVDFSQAVATQQQTTEALTDIQMKQMEIQEQQLKRIEQVEQGLNKLVKKQSFSKSIMGTILSAATTADPVLAAIGGIAGFLIGKAEDYKDAEKKNYDIQQDILRKAQGFYTNEELKLAAYANLDLDPNLISPEQIKIYANYVVEAKTRMRSGSWFPGQMVPGEAGQPGFMVASRQGNISNNYLMASAQAPMQELPNANYADVCYGHLNAARTRGGQNNEGITNAALVAEEAGDTHSLAIQQRRNLARYCFYSLR
ncbi:hypothetical protein [Halioxenophilus aromaticivorans]